MTGLHIRFSAVLLSALWLLPQAVRAADVTVDYSQLEPASNEYMPPANVEAENFFVKEPIHLHPLVAINSSTVKNLAAEDTREQIHLHPPAPKVLAAANTDTLHSLRDPAQTIQAASSIVPPTITNIDLSMAAVAPAVPAPPIETAAVPEATEPTEPPPLKTDIALDNVVVPVKPKMAKRESAPVPAPLESSLADAAPPAPITPNRPTKSTDDDAPAGFMRVNAVADKTDDLTPEDVVGLDLGTPPKTESQ